MGIGVVGASRIASAGSRQGADSFAVWVGPHVSAMTHLASRLVPGPDRDDVVQESLTAAWRKWSSYDQARGSPASWLLAIVADQSRKSRRRRQDVPLIGVAGLYVDRPADLDLERAVRGLPARQRMAVELHYFLDLPVTEVALTMQCAEGTVKATLSHARARLEGELGEEFG